MGKRAKVPLKSRHRRGHGGRISTICLFIPTVVGEPAVSGNGFTRSNVMVFAERLRRWPTRSEARFERLIRDWNDGALRGRYKFQHPVSGKWIVDFFFPEVRLAVEIDGSIHGNADQKVRDRMKEADCARFDITVVRFTNREVWGDPVWLRTKLREAWKKARNRENLIIGKRYR